MTKNSKQTKKSTKHHVPLFRRPWMIFIILLILVAGIIALLIYLKPSTESTGDQPQPTVAPNENPNQPAQPAEEQPSEESENPEDKTTQYEGEDPNTLENLTGSIARKTVTDGNLTVVATIDQYLSAPGTCTIEIKNPKGELVYTTSTNATPDVTTSICEPFVVATSRLGSGKFNLEIKINGDNKQGTITEEVEL